MTGQMQANDEPISAIAVGGEVVVQVGGPRPAHVAFTPDAIVASLEVLRSAAESAREQQAAGVGGEWET